MPIFAPRTVRSSSLPMRSRSRPSKSASPDTRAPRVSPSIVCVETLLPDPDSPTIASVRPRSTPNETPRTASTTPSGVGKDTTRSRTSSRRSLTWVLRPRPAALPRQPHGRDVAVEARLVERAVLHARRVVDVLLGLRERHDRGVLHDLRGRVLPRGLRLLVGQRGERLVDERVRLRVVVRAVIRAVGAHAAPVEE